jgi:hypothetical protein
MPRAQKKSTKRLRRRDYPERTPKSNDVEGLPPNENLRKDPDEVYGDTEIPHRGRSLRRATQESK